MAPAAGEVVKQHSISEVLAAGWRLSMTGMGGVFPWVLAAELLQFLPFANAGGLLDTDVSHFVDPIYLGKAIVFGALQAFLYAVAVLRLARLAGGSQGSVIIPALRAALSVLIAYIVYTLIALFGLGLGVLFFTVGLVTLGPLPGLLISLIPLAPTVAASTALAFFIYPAVLEHRGPMAALSESARLARSGWARASLIVSVPALALLAAWFAGNGVELARSMSETLRQLSNMQADVSTDQIQALLSGATNRTAVQGAWGWRLVGAVADAFAWWYTLAVCYAEYRDLRSRAEARAH